MNLLPSSSGLKECGEDVIRLYRQMQHRAVLSADTNVLVEHTARTFEKTNYQPTRCHNPNDHNIISLRGGIVG
jgi:hypothetical protein